MTATNMTHRTLSVYGTVPRFARPFDVVFRNVSLQQGLMMSSRRSVSKRIFTTRLNDEFESAGGELVFAIQPGLGHIWRIHIHSG
jgi:hypothetical protein